MQRNKIRLLPALLLTFAASAASASSDDAWRDFADAVAAKCQEAARPSLEFSKAVVDPFGSEHYGLALVTGKPKGGNGFVTFICVYNKQSKAAEIGTELKTDELDLLPEE